MCQLSVHDQKPNFLILDEPSNDIDLNTLNALERYLQSFNGVLIVVSHDRFFTDKVTEHLFVFEGNGIVKDYIGTLSEYAECLIEQENIGVGGTSQSSLAPNAEDKKAVYKEQRGQRNGERNAARKAKREMENLEKKIDKLRKNASVIQGSIDSTSPDEGWTVLAELTEKLDALNDEIDEIEGMWLEAAERVEQAEEAGIL